MADDPSADSRVERARTLVGTPFRLHGRDGRGLDCIGLVALVAGCEDAPRGYALRTDDISVIEGPLAARGFYRRCKIEAADILIMDAGPAQFHLGLWTGQSLIHADAALRRVVETPGTPRWPILSIWRR